MSYRKVLVTLDGSKLAEQALKHAVEIASPGANIHLLSVMATGRVSEIASLASANLQPGAAEVWPPIERGVDPQAADAREAYLRRVSAWLEQADYRVSVEVRSGDVIETIVSVAQNGFDVIVIATHGRTGISKVALGSVAEGVLEKSPCPVLIIPARAVKAE